jgi:hypothetical protein
MPDALSVEGTLQAAVVVVLEEAELTLGGQVVSVWRERPEGLRQDQAPMVVVERPDEVERAPWTSSLYRHSYETMIVLVVGQPARSDGPRVAREGLGVLRGLVQGALEAEHNLRLAHWAVMRGMWSLEVLGEDEVMGANLAVQGLKLSTTLMIGNPT